MPREINDYYFPGEGDDYNPAEPPVIEVPPAPPQEPPQSDGNPFEDAVTIAANEDPQITDTLPTVTGLGLHVDGDYLAYYASGNDQTTAGDARQNALDLIESFRSRVGADEVYVHMTAATSDKGLRYKIAEVKPYQSHRSGSKKPRNWAYLREFLENYTGPAFTVQIWADREADDPIGAAAFDAISGPQGYAGIATKDKDMRMMPGHHVNWSTRDLTVVAPGDYEVIGNDSKLYGLKFFYQQMLEGDRADAIPGLEFYKNTKGNLVNLGPKTAQKLLAPATTVDEAAQIVMDLYEGAYQNYWPERFVEQAALLWMRLDADADVDDFLTHTGSQQVSNVYPQEVIDAAAALVARVTA
jgi:DNA polymerase-1